MILPARLPLVGNRYTPFVYAIAFKGLNLSGASILSMIRLYPDAPGEPLATFAASLSVVTDNAVPTSTITLSLTEAQMRALPKAGEPGDLTVLAWDITITERAADQTDPQEPARGRKYVPLNGPFTINPGVTYA